MSFDDDKEKTFIIRHFFKDVRGQLIQQGCDAEMSGQEEEHFGVDWKIRISNNYNSRIYFHLDCLHTEQTDDWSIATEFDVFAGGRHIYKTFSIVYSKNGLYGVSPYINTNQYEQYSSKNKMPVEFHVTIKKMTGIKEKERKKLKNFDDDEAKEHSDVVLKIGDQKFYVCKMYLSFHSTYFKSLFSGNFEESQKSEIELKDINAQDFQNFLELIYALSEVNESTCPGILKLADYFDAPNVSRRCERVFLQKSNLSLKFKLHTAIKYGMENLKKQCFSEMDEDTDFAGLKPENAKDFDPEIWMELYDKLATFV